MTWKTNSIEKANHRHGDKRVSYTVDLTLDDDSVLRGRPMTEAESLFAKAFEELTAGFTGHQEFALASAKLADLEDELRAKRLERDQLDIDRRRAEADRTLTGLPLAQRLEAIAQDKTRTDAALAALEHSVGEYVDTVSTLGKGVREQLDRLSMRAAGSAYEQLKAQRAALVEKLGERLAKPLDAIIYIDLQLAWLAVGHLRHQATAGFLQKATEVALTPAGEAAAR